jgi:hypothetical protein
MKPLTLKPHESRRLAEAGNALIVRPVEPQPPFIGTALFPAVTSIQLHTLDRYETDWGFFDEDREYVCPFGKPGSETWGRETHWRDWREPGVVVYDATPELGEYRSNGELVRSTTLNGRLVPREQARDAMLPKFWTKRSPATMPKWASRFPRLIVATVRACRMSGLNNDEARAAGIDDWLCHFDGRAYDNAEKQAIRHTKRLDPFSPSVSLLGVFCAAWDRDYPKLPASADPWVFAVRVERRDADE